MKYIKRFNEKSSEDILLELKDILIELEDEGYYINIKRPDVIKKKESDDWILIKIESHRLASLGSDSTNKKRFYINDMFKYSLEHLDNYIKGLGYDIKYTAYSPIDESGCVGYSYNFLSGLLKREEPLISLIISCTM